MVPIPLSDFSSRVSRHYRQNRRPKTRYRVDQVLRVLASLRDDTGNLQVRTTADLTTDTVNRFVAHHGPHFNVNTMRGLLGSLSAVCTYAVEEDWLDRSPRFRRVRPRPSPPVRERFLEYDRVQQLLVHLRDRRLGWAGRRDYALAGLVSMTGVRLGEALGAKVADVRLGARFWRVYPNRGPLKTSRSFRDVPLCLEVAELLKGWIPWAGGEWLFPGTKKRGPWLSGNRQDRALGRLQEAAEAAGVGWVSYHALRHSFATIALTRWRLPLWMISKILGHGSIRTTELYLHVKVLEQMVAEVAPIGFGLGDSPLS